MNDYEHPEPGTQAEQVKALFLNRVIGVRQQDGILVGEGSFGFVERDSMFPEILFSLGRCPLEAELVPTAK